jgi:hypothetical protein
VHPAAVAGLSLAQHTIAMTLAPLDGAVGCSPVDDDDLVDPLRMIRGNTCWIASISFSTKVPSVDCKGM